MTTNTGTLSKHLGNVLSVSEHYMYEVKHHTATVWDAEKGQPTFVGINSHYTDSHCSADCVAVVDATPEVRAAFQAYRLEEKARDILDEALRDAWDICKGKRVLVVRGRKIAKGTRGVVKCTGTNRYGEWALVITDAGEETFTNPSNLEVEDVQDLIPTFAEARAQAARSLR